jgi:CRP-like cAMP-binding protein
MASQQDLPAGVTIYEAGDVSKGAYLIQSGKVDLITAENFRLVTLGAGEMFGELGLVIDDFRSVTAVTRTECALILIPKETLEKKFKAADPAIRGIFRSVGIRLREANRQKDELRQALDRLQKNSIRLEQELERYKRQI